MSARTGSALLSKLALLLCVTILGCGSSLAQYKENVLHAFNAGTDGSIVRTVVPDGRGNLYGTTSRGGTNDQGTLFKLIRVAGGWRETQMYSFPPIGDTLPDPGEGLVHDSAGNFYGVSPEDGLVNCQSQGYPIGCGTVWQLSHNSQGWKRTILYSFTGQSDGGSPGSLAIDASGNLYGVADGSNSDAGSVFKLSFNGAQWTFTTLYTFTGGADGGEPDALALDSSGNLFGTTYEGGVSNPDVCYDYYNGNTGCGVAFELSQSSNSWKYSLLYSFLGGDDGGNPNGKIALDAHGNIFGTAGAGANLNGVVFEVSHGSGGWTESALYAFGYVVPAPGVTIDAAGNIFGATQQGGLYNCDNGCGTVYELSSVPGGWTYNTVYSYAGAFDGQSPLRSPVVDSKGNLFIPSQSQRGAVGVELALAPRAAGWVAAVVHDFPSSADGIFPYGSLVRDSAGNLYGTTMEGGTHGWGAVYGLLLSGGIWKEKVLYSFTGADDGALPRAGLSLDSAGNLYGTAQYGGNTGCPGGCGTVF